MSYELADGSVSSDYKVGDKFLVVGDDLDMYPKGAVITYIENDYSRCPKFSHDIHGDWYEGWSELEAYRGDVKVEENTMKSMKIERMDYVDMEDFNLDELEVFETLIVRSGHKIDEELDLPQIGNWRHYGVTSQGYTGFYDCYFEDEGGRNLSEQFRKYLNSLESTERHPAKEYETQEIPPEYLTVKERLLALAEGKELEWLHVCEYDSTNDWVNLESYQSDFGDILYDTLCKVRVRKVKSDVEKAFDAVTLTEDLTTFDIFKAGYEAAKQEND